MIRVRLLHSTNFKHQIQMPSRSERFWISRAPLYHRSCCLMGQSPPNLSKVSFRPRPGCSNGSCIFRVCMLCIFEWATCLQTAILSRQRIKPWIPPLGRLESLSLRSRGPKLGLRGVGDALNELKLNPDTWPMPGQELPVVLPRWNLTSAPSPCALGRQVAFKHSSETLSSRAAVVVHGCHAVAHREGHVPRC